MKSNNVVELKNKDGLDIEVNKVANQINNLYQRQRQWSDRYLEHVKMILGSYLIDESSFDVDVNEATDLVVNTKKGEKIAVRIRDKKFLDYSDEFTLRYSLNSGVETELSKVLRGKSDLLFYGFGDDNSIVAYALIDLRDFRYELIMHPEILSKAKENIKVNQDGKSAFIAFKYSWFPNPVVKESYGI